MTDKTEKLARALDPTYEEYEGFIFFETPLPCNVCDTPTQWGHLDRDGESTQYTLTPLCPLHGLARRSSHLGRRGTLTPLEKQEQHASVVRFVVAMHDGKGAATVLASISLEDAPGFHVATREDFATEADFKWYRGTWFPAAWSVRYEAHQGADPVYCIVVWDDEYSSFHLCLQEGTVQPPQHLPDEDGAEEEEVQ